MQLVAAALRGRVKILISTALVLEYEAVLTRQEHVMASGLTAAEMNKLLDAVCAVATAVSIRWQWRPQLSDPNDEMVLETAINGRAEAIVTFNRTHFEGAAKKFGLAVISPREALGWVETR